MASFLFLSIFDKPFDVNFAIIVEANYSGEDKLERPVVVYVKQYEPADATLKMYQICLISAHSL